MKRQLQTIENIREKLTELKGKDVKMAVNRGRKKIVKFDAVLTDLYPSVFTVLVGDCDSQSYSYTEVLCGNVKVVAKTL
ncbi:MAG: Veg family protein [Christensenellales bacterium]